MNYWIDSVANNTIFTYEDILSSSDMNLWSKKKITINDFQKKKRSIELAPVNHTEGTKDIYVVHMLSWLSFPAQLSRSDTRWCGWIGRNDITSVLNMMYCSIIKELHQATDSVLLLNSISNALSQTQEMVTFAFLYQIQNLLNRCCQRLFRLWLGQFSLFTATEEVFPSRRKKRNHSSKICQTKRFSCVYQAYHS